MGDSDGVQQGCSSRVRTSPLGCYILLIRSRPPVGGISGGPQGAYSIALSGGYEDDVDLGYAL